MSSKGKIVVPGDVISITNETTRPGQGCYELHGKVYASLAGYLYIKEEIVNEKPVQILEVRSSDEQHDHIIPYIGGIVTARIANIGQRFAKCELLCVDDAPLTSGSEYGAILRKEDIRSHDRDKIDLPKCVQPGDIILARVISFGDNQSSFILSIAEDQLGVVCGISNDGLRLRAKDWHIMQTTDGSVQEPRKVAQIPHLNL